MNVSQTIDTALDRSVALGYGNVGLVVRRRLPGWPADPPRMDGRVVLVTGAASGLGLAAAQGFARLGGSVRALARDERRAAEAGGQIERAAPGADARAEANKVLALHIRSFSHGNKAPNDPGSLTDGDLKPEPLDECSRGLR